MAYDAFISYSHTADAELAPEIQAGMHRLAKPWYRLRAMRVVRDETDLTANPDLRAAIQEKMDGAEWLILLASSAAAQSPYVKDEVAHWLASKGRDRIMLALTEGDLVWDREAGDFDPVLSTAAPAPLFGLFADEPRYHDLRWARTEADKSLRNPEFLAAIADLAAPIRGIDKERLISEDHRLHRRARRLAAFAVTLLMLLAAGVTVAAATAWQQANAAKQATEEADAAEERRAAAEVAKDEAERLSLEAEAAAASAEQRRVAAVAAEDAARAAEELALEREREARQSQADAEKAAREAEEAAVEAEALAVEAARRRDLAVAAAEEADTAQAEAEQRQAEAEAAQAQAEAAAAAAKAAEAEALAEVDRQLTIAEAVRLAIAATENVSRDVELAALVAERAARTTLAPYGFVTIPAFASLDDVARSGWRATLRGHDSVVAATAFAENGSRIVTTGVDGDVRVWESSGRLTAVLEDPAAPISSAAISPDGTLVLTTAAGAGAANLWSADGSILVTFGHGGGPLLGARFHDGGVVTWDAAGLKRWEIGGALTSTVAGDYRGTLSPNLDLLLRHDFINPHIRLVTPSGTVLEWIAHSAGVRSASFSPDGALVVTTSEDRTAKLWTTDAALVATMSHPDEVHWATFSADGSRVLTASWNKRFQTTNPALVVWEADGTKVASLPYRVDSVGALSPDGLRVVFDGGPAAGLWEPGREGFERLPGGMTTAVFSADGSTIAAGYRDGNARLWAPEQFTTNGGEFFAEYSPDGALLLTGGFSDEPRLWTLGGDLVATLQGDFLAFSRDGSRVLTSQGLWRADGTLELPALASAGAFSADGTLIVTGYLDGALVWASDGAGYATIGMLDHAATILAVAVSPDGTMIATAGRDGVVKVWEPGGALLATANGHVGLVRTAEFSPDGAHLLTAGDDHTARLWTPAGQQVSVLEHGGAVVQARYQLDGSRIATASSDFTARIWSSDGALLDTLDHGATVLRASFSDDGSRIVTAAGDDATLWASDGTVLETLTHDSVVFGADFHPDGRRLVTATIPDSRSGHPIDGTVRIWETFGPLELVDEIERRLAGRELPTAECQAFRIDPCGP